MPCVHSSFALSYIRASACSSQALQQLEATILRQDEIRVQGRRS